MKKMVLLITGLLLCFACSSKDQITKDISVLPSEAHSFVRDNFSAYDIDWVKIDREQFKSDKYEVAFTDGTKIEFDNRGRWTEIEAKAAGNIPTSFLMPAVADYIRSEFPERRIVSLEKKRRGIEITLSNGLELTFDEQGRLQKMDD